MQAGKIYVNDKASSATFYFQALRPQKNGGMSGVMIHDHADRGRKRLRPVRDSVTRPWFPDWRECADAPAEVKAAVEAWLAANDRKMEA